MNVNIYLCYKRTLTSTIAASLIFEILRNNGYSVYYTRKLRNNDFISKIDEIVKKSEDTIVLLDERSFMAIEEGYEKFLESWFARELIACYKKNNNIIVICINGFSLPDKSELPEEVHFLYEAELKEFDTFNFNISNDAESIISALKSRPILKNMLERGTLYKYSADFLFYSDSDCNIYEYGYLVATLDSNVDKHHPFKYTVNRSGQHLFYVINNDTGQTIELEYVITPGSQKYIHIEWEPSKALVSINQTDIETEKDSTKLYNWGKSYFFGSNKYEPDYNKALLCFKCAAVLGNQKAIDFIRKYDHSLASIYKVPMDLAEKWYSQAAVYGSPEAWMKMGERKEAQSDYSAAIECYKHALELGHILATSEIERCQQFNDNPVVPTQELFFTDFNTIIQNFKRQIGSGRIGKYNREVNFVAIEKRLVKIREVIEDERNKRTMSVFISDSKHSKYHNRIFAFLGYLAQKEVFDNLSHKDILEICIDEYGENQSDVKAFINRMGKTNLKESNIAKMVDRLISEQAKSSLDILVKGLNKIN